MFNLLKADFYKLLKSRTFLFTILACLGIGLIHMLLPDGPADMMGVNSGIGALEMLGTNFHIQIFVAFITIFVTVEFHLGTIKNSISRGTGRIQIYLSKFLVSSTATVALLVVYTLIHIILGAIRWVFNPSDIITLPDAINFIALHALFVIAYTAFFMLIAIAFRSLAGALVTSYLYAIVITILLPAEGSLVRYELHWNVRNYGVFEPIYSNQWHGIIVALVWIAISLVAGLMIFKKQDIK